MKTIIPTTCTRDCPSTCGLLATVENGRLVRLSGNPEHPLTRGAACGKKALYVRRVYSLERVTAPMIRRGGRWEIVTWDAALDLVAERIKTLIAESGPEAILYYQGYGERTALKLLNRYFFSLLGGVTTLRGSLCGGTGQAAQNLSVGDRVSHDPLDHANSRSMILWGRNPVSTNAGLVPIIRDLRRRGGPVLLVDPARTRSAALADHHIAVRPGRDVFLALAAAKLILAAGAEDKPFLERHAEGVRDFLNLAERFSLDQLCNRAGVCEDQAQLIADTLITAKPTSILLGWGLHRHALAHQSIQAIDALGALSGNLGIPGGGVSQGFEEYGPYDQRFWGDELHPPRRTLLMPRIGEEILNATNPKIRMIFVTAANPVCMAPNTDKVSRAFRQTEFVVYSGHFLDDTADHAHVFLPATTFLEEQDVMASYGHNYVGAVNKVIEPVGECRSEFWMFQELARRFPFASEYRRGLEEWLEAVCAPLREQGRDQGGDLQALRSRPFRVNAPMVPYADRRFPTPSGKFRFLERLDEAEPSPETPEFPYTLLTVAPHDAICSERTLADHEPLPAVVLSARQAAGLGLEQGRLVKVFSPHGAVKARLSVDLELREDILVAERGGWVKGEHGLNRLTRDMASRVGDGCPYYETRVAVAAWPAEDVQDVPILVIEHSPQAPGGNFVKAILRRGARVTTLRPSDGDVLSNWPEGPEDFAGLVVLGGPQHAFDDASSPHFPRLMDLMRAFDAAHRPVAGICLGAQLLARAHGGTTYTLSGLEFGFVQHHPTPAAGDDPVIGAALPLPPLMEFHEDSFTLPPGATLLVQGEACPNQCFRVGRASYGFQFHLEADSRILADWLTLFRQGAIPVYRVYQDQFPDAYYTDLARRLPLLLADATAFCDKAALAWLRLCGEGAEAWGKDREDGSRPVEA
ncbi:molybdopterin-dependent oxidoreductase [Desulfonatronum sp. SC1]|uniref:molybdopterin-dependent oxidoreductase n=1 Tax=Desulfonatronum sp. SC1 TaxID=2109626 RepID=UPI0018EE73AF|nr:molybdopterin-dependent oxidoreductase [Desulfonatronum sp. SC1]